jgi:quercetin dioxygenase-like cupin family protein
MNPLAHFKKPRILSLLIAPALIVGVAFSPVSALGTPPCGAVGVNLLSPVPTAFFPSGSLDLMCNEQNLYGWKLKTKVKGDSDLYVNEVTFQPGGQSGWHSHPGPIVVTVIEGTLTVYHDDCTSETYSAGETFTEICGDIINVRNETAAEAKDIAVQIFPHGVPTRIDEADPGCPQVPPCPGP